METIIQSSSGTLNHTIELYFLCYTYTQSYRSNYFFLSIIFVLFTFSKNMTEQYNVVLVCDYIAFEAEEIL